MIVIKYGGHALPEPGATDPVISLIANEIKSGKKLVLVHGGGPQINAELSLHGIEGEFVAGYRKTSPAVFRVVQKVLSGDVLRTLVNQFVSEGVNAVGISAGDGGLIRAVRMRPIVDAVPVDIGLVGEVSSVNPAIIHSLHSSGLFPIVSPVAVSDAGEGLNLNADIVAGAIAGALRAEEVIFMTDVAGIYRNFPDPDSIITSISSTELASLLPSFSEGMVPKVEAALSAINAGVKRVRIIDGREVSNLDAALRGEGGTEIAP